MDANKKIIVDVVCGTFVVVGFTLIVHSLTMDDRIFNYLVWSSLKFGVISTTLGFLILTGGISVYVQTIIWGKANDLRKCPFCTNKVKRKAIICQFCRNDLPVETEKTISQRNKDEKNKKALLFVIFFALILLIAKVLQLKVSLR